jgi:hypothetical protein
MTKTLYYDKADQRFVVICMEGDRVRYHKIPKKVHDREQAEVIAEPLGMDFVDLSKAA